MNKSELSQELKVSENEVVRHWLRLVEKMKRRGIRLVKRGTNDYGIIDSNKSAARFEHNKKE
jgi:hypothetical protein